MSQAVKHISINSAHVWLLSSLAFSRRSFGKTEGKRTRHDSSGGVKKKKKKTKKRFRIVSQPFIATYWMSLVNEEWHLCRFACKGTYLTTYALCSVSLLTMAAICVDRPLALLSGLRYRQILTLKRT